MAISTYDREVKKNMCNNTLNKPLWRQSGCYLGCSEKTLKGFEI